MERRKLSIFITKGEGPTKGYVIPVRSPDSVRDHV